MVDKASLIKVIQKAFKGVVLSGGIGLYEADSVDLHVSEAERLDARKKDIFSDWKRIPENVIEKCFSSLSFMDEHGLKFAIPAFMVFSVKNFDSSASASIDSIIGALSIKRDWSFLSNEQKKAVASFIEFMILEADVYLDMSQASLAYEEIWSKYGDE